MSHSAVSATPCGKSPTDGGLNAGYLQSLPGLLKVGQTVSFCGTGDVTAESEMRGVGVEGRGAAAVEVTSSLRSVTQ